MYPVYAVYAVYAAYPPYAVFAVFTVFASRTGFSREGAGLNTMSSEELHSTVGGYRWMLRGVGRVRIYSN